MWLTCHRSRACDTYRWLCCSYYRCRYVLSTCGMPARVRGSMYRAVRHIILCHTITSYVNVMHALAHSHCNMSSCMSCVMHLCIHLSHNCTSHYALSPFGVVVCLMASLYHTCLKACDRWSCLATCDRVCISMPYAIRRTPCIWCIKVEHIAWACRAYSDVSDTSLHRILAPTLIMLYEISCCTRLYAFSHCTCCMLQSTLSHAW